MRYTVSVLSELCRSFCIVKMSVLHELHARWFKTADSNCVVLMLLLNTLLPFWPLSAVSTFNPCSLTHFLSWPSYFPPVTSLQGIKGPSNHLWSKGNLKRLTEERRCKPKQTKRPWHLPTCRESFKRLQYNLLIACLGPERQTESKVAASSVSWSTHGSRSRVWSGAQSSIAGGGGGVLACPTTTFCEMSHDPPPHFSASKAKHALRSVRFATSKDSQDGLFSLPLLSSWDARITSTLVIWVVGLLMATSQAKQFATKPSRQKKNFTCSSANSWFSCQCP